MRHDPNTRFHAGTYGVGVSWRPKRRPWVTVFFASILAAASIMALVSLV